MGEQERTQCARCGETKPIDAFAWRNKERGRRAPFCRTCQAEYNRRHYLANKAVYVARAEESKRRTRLRRTKLLLEHFATHPCVDCGETDPVVLEFDHLRDKEFEIASDYVYRRWDTVLAEIAKCEVVCANCHRRRTSMRYGALRVLLTSEPTAIDGAGPGDAPANRPSNADGGRS